MDAGSQRPSASRLKKTMHWQVKRFHGSRWRECALTYGSLSVIWGNYSLSIVMVKLTSLLAQSVPRSQGFKYSLLFIRVSRIEFAGNNEHLFLPGEGESQELLF